MNYLDHLIALGYRGRVWRSRSPAAVAHHKADARDAHAMFLRERSKSLLTRPHLPGEWFEPAYEREEPRDL